MTRKQRRLAFALAGLASLGAATALVLVAAGDSLVYFYTPSEVVAKHVGPGRLLRIGGLVEQGSVVKDGTTVRFAITDLTERLAVSYTGILPDLFREGQGVVAEGRMEADGRFAASEVLAKHDEHYMPKEVVEALKKSGRWQEQEGKK